MTTSNAGLPKPSRKRDTPVDAPGLKIPGRPISVGAQAKPFTLRLDAVRRAKLDEAAQRQHTTPSQLMRELIDAL